MLITGLLCASASASALTFESGREVGAKFLPCFLSSFEAGDPAQCDKLFSDGEVSWDWTDGKVGKGTKKSFFDMLSKSWQLPIISSLHSSQPHFVVDPTNRKVAMSMDLVSNVDGKLGKACLCNIANLIEVTLDGKDKVRHVRVMWDMTNPDLVACTTKLGISTQKVMEL